MFRFSIRDVLWLTVVVALAVGWWIEHRRHVASSAAVKALEATVADHEATILMLNTSWMAASGTAADRQHRVERP
jgi:hypothetical protein